MDVLWFRLTHKPTDVAETMGRFDRGSILVMLDRGDYWQCAYVIPKGSQVLTSQWVVHRDPRWFPNPEGFDPERWTEGRAKDIPRFAYFPFGGGPRICIGNHFAMMEATLILVMIAQRFRIELLPGQRLELEPSVTLRQAGPGLRVHVVEREADAKKASVPVGNVASAAS